MTELTDNQSSILQYILDNNNEVYSSSKNYNKEEIINDLKDFYGSNLSDNQFKTWKESYNISKEQENIINNVIKDQKELNPYKIENINRLNKLKQSFIKRRQKLKSIKTKKSRKSRKSIKSIRNISSDTIIVKNIGKGKKKHTKKRRKKYKEKKDKKYKKNQ